MAKKSVVSRSLVEGSRKPRLRQNLTKEIEDLKLTLAEERRNHAEQIKRLQSNYVKIQKLLHKESARCEALQTELCELTEKHFQDQVVISSLKSENRKNELGLGK